MDCWRWPQCIRPVSHTGQYIYTFTSFESQVGSANIFDSILIYHPAGVFLSDFTDFLSSIIKLEKVFNVHVDDTNCNTATYLFSITDSFSFIKHGSGLTHRKAHTLDLVFSLELNTTNLCVNDVHGSDHC